MAFMALAMQKADELIAATRELTAELRLIRKAKQLDRDE
jgi:hypothetical protein